MRYFTGDESGLIKRVVFLPPPLEKKASKKRSHDEEESKGDDKKAEKKKQEDEPLNEVTVFGTLDKQAAVQKMAWATVKGERLVVVARQNGKVDFLHPETGDVVKSFEDKAIAQAQADKPKTNTLRFIGLETTDTHLLTCNSDGALTWTPLDDDNVTELVVVTSLDKSTTTGGSTIAGPGTDLNILRAHPVHRHLLAVAGKDIDVQIYDLNVLLAAQAGVATKDTAGAAAPTPTPSKSTSTRTPKPHPRQKQKQGKLGLIHEAKNVKNDFLDLPQPVWVHDLQFMNENGTQVAVATHYHQIRLYDFTKGRRPVLTVDIGKVPLTTLSVGMDFDHVIFTDTRNDVGLFNVRNGKVVAQLKGFAGAGKATISVPIPTFTSSSSTSSSSSSPSTADNIKAHTLVSVALDRTLRLHELETKYRKLEKKVYLKQRLTALLVDTDYVVPDREPTEEDKEDEELWDTMETVRETKKPRLARK